MGVYFNDKSNIIDLNWREGKFMYVEQVNSEYRVQKFSQSDYPEKLNKKVRLLKYFANQLLGENR